MSDKLKGLRLTVAYIKAHGCEPLVLFSSALCRELVAALIEEGDPLFKTGEAMEKKYPGQVADLDGVAIVEDSRAPVASSFMPSYLTQEIERGFNV